MSRSLRTFLAALFFSAFCLLVGELAELVEDHGGVVYTALLLAASVVAMVCCAAAALVAGVELGSPCIPPQVSFLSALVAFLIMMMRVGGLQTAALFIVCSVVGCIELRGAFFVVQALTMTGMLVIQWARTNDIAGSDALPETVSDVLALCPMLLASATKYKHDQLKVLLLNALISTVTALPGFLKEPDGGVIFSVGLAVVLIGILGLVLCQRQERVLPPALRRCRFIRFEYLRFLADTNTPLRRCQELPEEAFGDVTKASILIIVSHRWMDRYKCDVKGMRVQTMVEKLDQIFPRTLCGRRCCGSCSGFWHWVAGLWRSMRYGGNDVLFFFDFMSLPQEGKTEDDVVIERTQEEAALFNEALPAMGALYTRYPVLVLTETTGDAHGYFDSGWCFSELNSAMLASQLHQYSSSAVQEYLDHIGGGGATQDVMSRVMSATISQPDVDEFNALFADELATKRFFSESDREVVRGIVGGQMLQRLLADAVAQQDVEEVRRCLRKLAEQGLERTLDHALDDAHDTLMHRAVRLPSAEIVEELMAAGASPAAVNMRGDTPLQFFMLPRCLTPAARHCRRLMSGASGGYRTVPHAGASRVNAPASSGKTVDI